MTTSRRKLFGTSLLCALWLSGGGLAFAAEQSEHQDSGGDHDSSHVDHHEDHSDGNNGEGASSQGGSSSSSSSGSVSTNNGAASVSAPSAGGQANSNSLPYANILNAPVLNQREAKQVVKAGQAASLPLLLTYMDNNYPGQILDVKLRDADIGYVYEVRYLSNAIFLRTVFLDGMTLVKK